MSILFDPFTINGMTLRNRIVRSATHETMATLEGMPSAELRQLLERLADGKAGLIVAGGAYVNKLGQGYPLQNGAHADALIPEWRKITEAVHEKGAKIAMQIMHNGRQGRYNKTLVAPSVALNPNTLVWARPITEEEIWQTIRDFGSAAGRVKSAGFDAVQIQAAHGYLISSFLSPFTNRRRDKWGGDPERRFRFLAEVYRAVREAVGPDYPVLCKLNVDDFLGRFGLTPRESFPAARRLAEMGLDALEISGGVIDTFPAISRGDVPTYILTRGRSPLRRLVMKCLVIYKLLLPFRENYYLPYAERLRPTLKIPLMLVGGVRRINAAEQILEQSKADLISLCRPLVREFRLPKRWSEGDLAPARCISCNRCFFEGDRDNKLMCYQKVKIEEWIKKGLLKRERD